MFFAERWQQTLVSIEIYASFGVNRQVYYFVNGAEKIHKLLKKYEAEKVIDIRYWAVPDIDEINAKTNLYGRDQIGSTNDCYQLYREAADFIIVHDIDDVLLLEHGQDYYSAFQAAFYEMPFTAYLFYGSYAAELIAPNALADFDIESTLKTAKVGKRITYGKSVYDPSRVETVWIHRPDFTVENFTVSRMPLKAGFFFHMRKWTLNGKNDTSVMYKVHQPNEIYPCVRNILPKDKNDMIVQNVKKRIQLLLQCPDFFDLTSTDYYYNLVDKCVVKYTGQYAEIDGCRTPYACPVDAVEGFTCVESVQNFKKHFLNSNFMIYVALSQPSTITLDNGCKV